VLLAITASMVKSNAGRALFHEFVK
jgi:hypothetical protein